MRWLVALVLAAGCGRLGFDPHAGDARGDAPAGDAVVCTWSTPIALPGPIQSTDDDWAPTPTRGGLQLYFFSFRTGGVGGADLWYATRQSVTAEFGAAADVTQLDTTDDERSPTLTDDGLDILFARDTATTGDIYEAQREETDDPFGTAVLAPNLSSSAADADPFVSADGLRVVFASSRIGPDQHGLDLFESTRPSRTDSFAVPTELAALDTDEDDFAPTLSADALDIWFSSTRPGGPGGADIYTAHRDATDLPFGAPTLVPALSSPLDDVDPRLSLDGTTMYLNYATVTSGGANADLDVSTRSCD
ncbi:MAG TPA: hypothetical protein VLX92_24910 [Kofleriaceae bacterium]|nr:hypothetical protein [Kofleriaceae bacterium]